MGFWGLLASMFAGAANDNLVKTAFVVAITTLSWDLFGFDAITLANLAALCFILPFIIFASQAAHRAKQLEPKRWLLVLKLIELTLAAVAAIAIYQKAGWLLLACIAGFGIQSAFIGPLKYSLIPKLARQEQLLEKNAWMESATFVAILIGTLIGADWIIDSQLFLVGLIALLSITGIVGACLIPKLPASSGQPQHTLSELIHRQRSDPRAMSAIWCISGFWGLGSVWLTHLPSLAVDIWQLSANSVGILLSYFVAGIAMGAFAGVFSERISLTVRVMSGSVFMIIGGLLIQTGTYEFAPYALLLTSAGGGYLALPLYTRLQDDQQEVADRIAVNNIANAMMIVLTAVASIIVVAGFGLSLLIWLLILSFGQLLLCLYHRRNLSLS